MVDSFGEKLVILLILLNDFAKVDGKRKELGVKRFDWLNVVFGFDK